MGVLNFLTVSVNLKIIGGIRLFILELFGGAVVRSSSGYYHSELVSEIKQIWTQSTSVPRTYRTKRGTRLRTILQLIVNKRCWKLKFTKTKIKFKKMNLFRTNQLILEPGFSAAHECSMRVNKRVQVKPSSQKQHKHKDKINTKTKHDISSRTYEDQTRIFLCFVLSSVLGLCLDYDLMLMITTILKPGSHVNISISINTKQNAKQRNEV